MDNTFCYCNYIHDQCVQYKGFDNLTTIDPNVNYFIHAPHNHNIGSITKRVWCTQQFQKLVTSLDNLHNFQIVVHSGKGDKIEDTLASLQSLRFNSSRKVLIENAAGQKSELGYSWEELEYLFNHIDRRLFGLCLDTQHSFASGICSFTTLEETRDWIQRGINLNGRIDLIHLNDSKVAFNSHVDRHEYPGNGFIWKNNQETLKYIMKLDCPKVIEVNYNIDHHRWMYQLLNR